MSDSDIVARAAKAGNGIFEAQTAGRPTHQPRSVLIDDALPGLLDWLVHQRIKAALG
jgi:hypothetical protein